MAGQGSSRKVGASGWTRRQPQACAQTARLNSLNPVSRSRSRASSSGSPPTTDDISDLHDYDYLFKKPRA